jgi:two-component system nitrate/nitrite response regulator NarL
MSDASLLVETGADWPACRDDKDKPGDATGKQAPRSILVLSDIRFFREGLAEVLQRDGAFANVGLAADVDEALAETPHTAPDIILVDASLPDGLAAVSRLCSLTPRPQIVALALMERETAVIAWAEAGVSGYVPRNTGLVELVSLLTDIMRGEQTCSRRIAASLLRRVSRSPRQMTSRVSSDAPSSLTFREQQVTQLISVGLSNKEIARRLNIGLGTTKSHVHKILGKLALNRRGQIAQWRNDSPVSFDVLWGVAPQIQEQPSGNRRAAPIADRPSIISPPQDGLPTRYKSPTLQPNPP